jgi:hypothetical protein
MQSRLDPFRLPPVLDLKISHKGPAPQKRGSPANHAYMAVKYRNRLLPQQYIHPHAVKAEMATAYWEFHRIVTEYLQ